MITVETLMTLSLICYVLGIMGLVDGILLKTPVPSIACSMIGLSIGSVTGYWLYTYLLTKLSYVPVKSALAVIPIACVTMIYRHIDYAEKR